MKTSFILGLFLVVFLFNSYSQSGEWTWMAGDSTEDSQGYFGVKGVGSSYNIPPNLKGATSWTDKNGNFWLFGGFSNDNSGNYQLNYNTLWEFNPGTLEWTWVSGSDECCEFGIYGTKGFPSINNSPGSRGYATGWVDLEGNLWLYGGNGYASSGADQSLGFLNDLWKFDIITKEWTWVKGSDDGIITYSPGVYGTLGVPDTANTPTGRLMSCSWTDLEGHLWMFGGYNNQCPNSSYFNDLWKYDIPTNTWTWMKGSDQGDQPSVYGTLGVEDSLNVPAGRACSCNWTDSADNLYFLGGEGYIYLSVLSVGDETWRYSIATGDWTYINGGFYFDTSEICITYPGLYPQGKVGASSFTNQPSSTFWMFGGKGGYIYGNISMNDLWKYDLKKSLWTRTSGHQLPSTGHYGTKGISSPLNLPRTRMMGASWTDKAGNLWVFGGAFQDDPFLYFPIYNDLWRYTPDSTCGAYTIINSLSAPLITVNPNPASSYLRINTSMISEARAVIIDMYGRKVFEDVLFANQSDETINVQDFREGMYFLVLYDNAKKIWSEKVVIQH
jgi:hypothetical protein